MPLTARQTLKYMRLGWSLRSSGRHAWLVKRGCVPVECLRGTADRLALQGLIHVPHNGLRRWRGDVIVTWKRNTPCR